MLAMKVTHLQTFGQHAAVLVQALFLLSKPFSNPIKIYSIDLNVSAARACMFSEALKIMY